MWSGVRRVARSGSRRGVAVQLRGKSSASMAGNNAVLRLRGVNGAVQMRGLFTRKTEAVPIVQAIALDKFGKQHHVQVKPTVRASSDSEEVLLMTKWAAALLATGACMAGAMGESGQAHAASSGGSKNSDTENLLEQIKKKVQAFAEENKDALQNILPAQMGDVQKQIDDFLASGKGGQVSWGFMMGACSGFALKKVSKLGAVALGSVFILFQCASYAGYIDVNHKKLEKDVMDVLDINKDGVFDSKDVDDVYKRVMKVLEYSMPAGSGFAVGFLVGFRAG